MFECLRSGKFETYRTAIMKTRGTDIRDFKDGPAGGKADR